MRRLTHRDLIVASCLSIAIFVFLLNFINIPDPRGWRDEGQFFYACERIIDGQVPYRDFHEFHYPGSFYILAGIFSVFGTTQEAGRVFTYIMVSAGVGIYFLISRVIISNLLLALFPAVFFSFAGIPQWFSSLPHWFSFFTTSLAIFFLVYFSEFRKSSPLLFVSGIFSGLTFSIQQNEGIFLFVGAGLFLMLAGWWTNRRLISGGLLAFSAGFIITASAFPVYFLLRGDFGYFWKDTFLSLFESYLPANRMPSYGYFAWIAIKDLAGNFNHVRNIIGVISIVFFILGILFLQYSPIFVYPAGMLIFLLSRLKKFGVEIPMTFGALSFIGLFLFFSHIHKPDPIRLMFVSFPCWIITIFLLNTFYQYLREKNRKPEQGIILVLLLTGYSVVFLYAYGYLNDINRNFTYEVNTAGGTILFESGEKMRDLKRLQSFINEKTEINERIYIHNWAVQYYFLLKRHNVISVDGLLSGHNTPEQMLASLQTLEASPPRYIITDNVLNFLLSHPERSPFPTIKPEVLLNDPVWEFIRVNYRPVMDMRALGLRLWERGG